ncbi:unnamed protein product, partial [Polarella glacialis]
MSAAATRRLGPRSRPRGSTGIGQDTREFVDFGVGDVRVLSGQRLSLVLWLKDSPEAVAAGTSPWYHEAAAAGDADAQSNLGQNYFAGRVHYFPMVFGSHSGTESFTCSSAMFWWRQAAEQGYADAQRQLACYWLLAAAKQEARKLLPGGLEARNWKLTSAGSALQAESAVLWLLMAAGCGSAEAQLWLGELCLARAAEKSEPPASTEDLQLHNSKDCFFRSRAWFWLAEAAKRGNLEAQLSLGQALLSRATEVGDNKSLFWALLGLAWLGAAAGCGGDSYEQALVAALRAPGAAALLEEAAKAAAAKDARERKLLSWIATVGRPSEWCAEPSA